MSTTAAVLIYEETFLMGSAPRVVNVDLPSRGGPRGSFRSRKGEDQKGKQRNYRARKKKEAIFKNGRDSARWTKWGVPLKKCMKIVQYDIDELNQVLMPQQLPFAAFPWISVDPLRLRQW